MALAQRDDIRHRLQTGIPGRLGSTQIRDQCKEICIRVFADDLCRQLSCISHLGNRLRADERRYLQVAQSDIEQPLDNANLCLQRDVFIHHLKTVAGPYFIQFDLLHDSSMVPSSLSRRYQPNAASGSWGW